MKKLLSSLSNLSRKTGQRHLPTFSASVAFYAFLSLFPLSMLLAGLLNLWEIPQEAVLAFLYRLLPPGVYTLVGSVLYSAYLKGKALVPLSAMILLWSGANAASELIKGMGSAADIEGNLGYLPRRLLAMGLTLLMLLLAPVFLVLLVLSSRLVPFRPLMALPLLWLVIVCLYRAILGKAAAYKRILLCALLSTLSWGVFSTLFSLYVQRLFDPTVYGGLSALVLTLLWLYYCFYILLLGAYFCCTKKAASIGSGLPAESF